VDHKTFAGWVRTKPALKGALERARKTPDERHREGYGTFRDFVYARLPARLRRLWDEVNKVAEGATRKERARALLGGERSCVLQHLFLYALVSCNFNAAEACRKVGISRSTYVGWCQDADFAGLLDGMNDAKKDFFESALIRLVREGDTSAIIFANRTINRDRGYGDKVPVNGCGAFDQDHTVGLEELPLDLRVQLLKAVRGRKGARLGTCP
jgi:hypothetical protein